MHHSSKVRSFNTNSRICPLHINGVREYTSRAFLNPYDPEAIRPVEPEHTCMTLYFQGYTVCYTKVFFLLFCVCVNRMRMCVKGGDGCWEGRGGGEDEEINGVGGGGEETNGVGGGGCAGAIYLLIH